LRAGRVRGRASWGHGTPNARHVLPQRCRFPTRRVLLREVSLLFLVSFLPADASCSDLLFFRGAPAGVFCSCLQLTIAAFCRSFALACTSAVDGFRRYGCASAVARIPCERLSSFFCGRAALPTRVPFCRVDPVDRACRSRGLTRICSFPQRPPGSRKFLCCWGLVDGRQGFSSNRGGPV